MRRGAVALGIRARRKDLKKQSRNMGWQLTILRLVTNALVIRYYVMQCEIWSKRLLTRKTDAEFLQIERRERE
jgi:hypothetical protein